MHEELIALDTSFDFDNAFKQNYCTLLNFAIFSEEIKKTFTVDSVPTTLKHPDTLCFVGYREWQHENWFPLSDPTSKDRIYWTSPALAQVWLEKMKGVHDFETLTRDQAFEVAKLHQTSHQSMLSILKK